MFVSYHDNMLFLLFDNIMLTALNTAMRSSFTSIKKSKLHEKSFLKGKDKLKS